MDKGKKKNAEQRRDVARKYNEGVEKEDDTERGEGKIFVLGKGAAAIK